MPVSVRPGLQIWPRGMGVDYGRAYKLRGLLDVLLDKATALVGAQAIGPRGDSSKTQQQVLGYKPCKSQALLDDPA
jgi:hypothetical protein